MIEIIMDNCLRFDITNLDKDMLKQIKKDFRVSNPQYINEQMMKSNNPKNSKDSEVPKYLNMYSVKNNMIEIPRGWSSYLCYWLEQYNYEYDIIDNRLVTEIIDYPKLKFPLFKHQSKWVKKGHLLTQGTVESPCFIKGSQVSTLDGYKNIEDVNTDDLVFAYDTKKDIIELKNVLATKKIPIGNKKLVKVTIFTYKDEITIVCTDNHKFYSEGEWIEAKYLKGRKVLIDNNLMKNEVVYI